MILLSIVLCLAQKPQPAPAAQSKNELAQSDAEREFDALENAYKSALQDYNHARIVAERNGQKLTAPHPVRTWFPLYDKLARGGYARAHGWVVENLALAVQDPAERARRIHASFDDLIAHHPDEEAIVHALNGLATCADAVGMPDIDALLERVVRATHHPEVAARAMSLQAWSVTDRGRSTDPEKRQAALEIRRSILILYPTTSIAKEVAGVLLSEAQQLFLEQSKRWISDVRALQKQSAAPSEWPKQPIRELALTLAPLSDAANMAARALVGSLVPAFDQAERQGLAFLLAWYSKELAAYYPSKDAEWARIRTGLLTILVTQFPTAESIPAAFDSLAREADTLAGGAAEECAQLAYEKSTLPAVRANALMTLGKTLRAVGDQPAYLRAAAALERFKDEFKDDPRAEEARRSAELLRNALPGASAPEIVAKDTDGLEFKLSGYRGRVLLLVFWDLSESSKAAVPEILALEHELRNRPFAVVGANTDRLMTSAFKKQSADLSIDWRSAMLYSAANIAIDDFQVRRWPTRVVIDSSGIIRARDLPWSEMTSLVAKLVAETEAAARK